MLPTIIIGIVIMLIVLVMTLFSISKGYAYKHTVDPLPEEDKEK
ncbi:YtzI protein [Lentibacillus sp. Marseille-P4043]|nr:YtzI protein [Lentibacillus sp. Marseille-P4043]